MRAKAIITALLLLLLFPAALLGQNPPDVITHNKDYIEGDVLGVVAHAPNQNTIFLMNMPTDQIAPENEWITVDVSEDVPEGTKAIFVTIMFAITHGTTPQICNMFLYLRKYGETTEWGVSTKQVIVDTEGGIRDGYSHWIPLSTDRKFQVKWLRYTTGTWPEYCAYGFNIWLEAYLRGGEPLSESGFLPSVWK